MKLIQSSSLTLISIIGLFVTSLLLQPAMAAPNDKEQKLKVAFLYQFAKYTSWPTDSGSEFAMCFLGDNPFQNVLSSIKSKKIGGKPLAFADINNASEAQNCQLVYVTPDKSAELATLQGQPILTVGETAGFIEQGGLINFVRKGTKQKFEVNGNSQALSNISFSSKLLKIGIVKT